MIEYKFNEPALLEELSEYVDRTYGQHYSKNSFQSSEFIMDCGHGMGFFLGNVLKYAQRYGKKDGANRKDLMKILHYGLLALNQHDKQKYFDDSMSITDDSISITDLNISDSITATWDSDSMYNSDSMMYNISDSVDTINLELDFEEPTFIIKDIEVSDDETKWTNFNNIEKLCWH